MNTSGQAGEKGNGARMGARLRAANGRRSTCSASSIAKLLRDWMQDVSARFGGADLNVAIGVRAGAGKAPASEGGHYIRIAHE